MFHKLLGALVGVFVLGAAGSAGATIITINGTGGISNVDQWAGTFHQLNSGSGGNILDVDVSVELSGTQWGDLDMFIVHGGTTVELLNTNNPADCCSSGAFDVTFDDEAGNSIGSPSALVGDFTPQHGSLSDFDGMDLAGIWDLQIFEDYCCTNETDLVAWSITVEVGERTGVPEPGTLALLSTGLVGLGRLGRRRRKDLA